MINVRDLIRKKGSEVFSVRPDAAVLDALRLMAEKNTGAVMVMVISRFTKTGNYLDLFRCAMY